MLESKTRFADLLYKSVYRIKFVEGKNIGDIQEELGQAIGKNKHAIEHLRKEAVAEFKVRVTLPGT